MSILLSNKYKEPLFQNVPKAPSEKLDWEAGAGLIPVPRSPCPDGSNEMRLPPAVIHNVSEAGESTDIGSAPHTHIGLHLMHVGCLIFPTEEPCPGVFFEFKSIEDSPTTLLSLF